MAKLNTAERKALPKSDFAGPGRSFPIPDKSHAEQALRMKGHASPSAQKQIVAKVHDRFPGVGSSSEKGAEGAQRETMVGNLVGNMLSKKKPK